MFVRQDDFEIRVFLGRSGGKTYITIADEFKCPVCPYVTLYMESLCGAVSSKRVAAYELLFLLNYFKSLSQSVDLSERVQIGQFLSSAELKDVVHYAKFTKSADDFGVTGLGQISDKSLINAIEATQKTRARVKNAVARARISRLLSFIEFHYDSYHADNQVPEEVESKYKLTCKRLIKAKRALNHDDSSVECRDLEPAIPPDIFFRMLEIIRPESLENPFKHSRLRNYLIIALILETGLRCGAVAKLKIGDFKFWGTFDEIQNVRRPDDPSDPRKYRPSQKTQSHHAFVSPELMHEIKRYIDDVRTRESRAHNHEMIFITEMDTKGTVGQPLSLSAINKIFEVLSQALSFHLHPHRLRRQWNEMLTELGQSSGKSDDEIEKLRRYAMGWTRNSQMGEVYNKFKIAEAVKELQKQRQDAITSAECNYE